MNISKTEKAVVVIGSGPGGATVSYELTKRGIPVVMLEAGPRIQPEDYKNDEWPAFSQMAWLDKRTMTGSARIVKDFNGLPCWLVKAVGGTATHWAGATPRGHLFPAKATSAGSFLAPVRRSCRGRDAGFPEAL